MKHFLFVFKKITESKKFTVAKKISSEYKKILKNAEQGERMKHCASETKLKL